ncbi:ATP-binding protein [candidate division KSB1 bacterium]
MARKKEKYLLRLASKSANLHMIREFVSRVAAEAGFHEDEINQIELAVDEASSNVVQHAYPEKNRNIEIEVRFDPTFFEVKVRDSGKGFIPERLPRPNMKEYLEQFQVGGLGIHLMNSLMDQVEFDINPGRRNQVTLIKFRK